MTEPTTNAQVRAAWHEHRIVRPVAEDPDDVGDGAVWYNTTVDELRAQVGGVLVTLDTTPVA